MQSPIADRVDGPTLQATARWLIHLEAMAGKRRLLDDEQ
jgi:hypothetical protein